MSKVFDHPFEVKEFLESYLNFTQKVDNILIDVEEIAPFWRLASQEELDRFRHFANSFVILALSGLAGRLKYLSERFAQLEEKNREEKTL